MQCILVKSDEFKNSYPLFAAERASSNIIKTSKEYILGYLKDSNAAAYSGDSNIFYVVTNLSACSKSYIITFIS